MGRALTHHSVAEARDQGWDTLRNGDLLNAAEDAGFEVFITTYKNIRYQQNLSHRRIAILVLGRGRWRLIQRILPQVLSAVDGLSEGGFVELEIPEIE